MRRFIIEGPSQLVEARDAAAVIRFPKRKWSCTLLLGMGGSALAGGLVDLLRNHQRCAWDWRVVREYGLPVPAHSSVLTFALSYSGNTEETLASMGEAAAGGACIVAVSSGGKLEESAREAGIPWVGIPRKPEGFQPRFAIYFMFGVLYEALCRTGHLREVEDLGALASWLHGLDLESRGKALAAWIGRRTPVVYSPPAYETGVARVWRIKLNENSKVPAMAGAIPEANHNEMIAFTPEYADRYCFLLLPSDDAHPRIQRRFDLLSDLLRSAGYPVGEARLEGGNPLRRALSSLLLADWTSYYLALERNVDPIAIPAIQEFKKKL